MDMSCRAGAVTEDCYRVDYSNYYLAGVISIIAVVFAVLRLSETMWECFERKFKVSIRVSGGMINCGNDMKPYYLLLGWLTDNLRHLQHYKLGYHPKVSDNGQEDETEFSYQPTFGTHYFRYKGRWIKLVREQTPEIVCNEIPYESMTLSAWPQDESLLVEIMNEAKSMGRVEDDTKTSFYAISYGDWNMLGQPKKRRQLSSVILPKKVQDTLVGDIKEFLASETWYSERGIPYRRGYLLHGPPGCGKSSVIKAIAGEIGYDVCILSLSSKDLTDDGLNQLMNVTPAKSIILMEDIESAFKSRETGVEAATTNNLAFEGSGSSKVTFRGLLNALDGVASTEGRLVFLTTNYVERLDPALARPGRVDLKVMVGLPDSDQVERMFTRFYPESTSGLEKKFAELVAGIDGDVSMAMIQGLFMLYKTNPEGALEHAKEYFEEQHFSIKKQEEIEKKTEATAAADNAAEPSA